jgi:hypothetical protein
MREFVDEIKTVAERLYGRGSVSVEALRDPDAYELAITTQNRRANTIKIGCYDTIAMTSGDFHFEFHDYFDASKK